MHDPWPASCRGLSCLPNWEASHSWMGEPSPAAASHLPSGEKVRQLTRLARVGRRATSLADVGSQIWMNRPSPADATSLLPGAQATEFTMLPVLNRTVPI